MKEVIEVEEKKLNFDVDVFMWLNQNLKASATKKDADESDTLDAPGKLFQFNFFYVSCLTLV